MKALSDAQVGLVVRRARALSDPTRVRILEVLGRSEQPVGQIATTLGSQPSTVSKHLQVLFLAGLVHRRRAASAVIYSITDVELLSWSRYLGAPEVGASARRA